MYNGRPIGKKKQIQIMVALTILAWATQTLHHQWGFGAEVQFQPPALSNASARVDAAAPVAKETGDADEAVGGEKFVAGESRFAVGTTLELRSEANIIGGEIKLKQVCRWSDADKATFAPLADFVLERVKQGVPFKSISVPDVRSTLQDAGVNVAMIDFVGATTCTVSRTDVPYDEHAALDQWINAKEGTDESTKAPAATQPTLTVMPSANQNTAQPAAAKEEKQYHTLRELLTADLATRSSLPIESLQVAYRAQDEKVLNLSEPTFRFQIDPIRARNLGDVSWSVTVLADTGSQRLTVNAEARAWQQELVLSHPLSTRQVIREDDFLERRALVDTLPLEPLLTKDQLVGQQASRELKPGTVLTSRMVEAVPMVKAGQFVSITLRQGGVEIKTVARAMEAGSYGQSIRCRNETTRDVFEVTLTGPQAATMDSTVTTPKVASAQ